MMKKEKKDKDFIKSAYFEGGRAALDAHVRKVLRYPKEAIASKIEGTVTVRYTVDYKGKVIDATVVAGIGYGCDEEALRIVRDLQFKVPEDGKIKSKYSRKLHIHFRLPGSPAKLPATKKIPAKPGAFQIQYQYTTTSSGSAKPSLPKTSYQIQIQLPVKKKTQ